MTDAVFIPIITKRNVVAMYGLDVPKAGIVYITKGEIKGVLDIRKRDVFSKDANIITIVSRFGYTPILKASNTVVKSVKVEAKDVLDVERKLARFISDVEAPTKLLKDYIERARTLLNDLKNVAGAGEEGED